MSGKPPPKATQQGPVTRLATRGRAPRQQQPLAARLKRRNQIEKALKELPKVSKEWANVRQNDVHEQPGAQSPTAFLEDEEFPAADYMTPQPDDPQSEHQTAGPSTSMSAQQPAEDDVDMDDEAPQLPESAAPTGLDEYVLSDPPATPTTPQHTDVESVEHEKERPAATAGKAQKGKQVLMPPATATRAPSKSKDPRPRARPRANSSPTPIRVHSQQPLEQSGIQELPEEPRKMPLATLESANVARKESAVRSTIPATPAQPGSTEEGAASGHRGLVATPAPQPTPLLAHYPHGTQNVPLHPMGYQGHLLGYPQAPQWTQPVPPYAQVPPMVPPMAPASQPWHGQGMQGQPLQLAQAAMQSPQLPLQPQMGMQPPPYLTQPAPPTQPYHAPLQYVQPIPAQTQGPFANQPLWYVYDHNIGRYYVTNEPPPGPTSPQWQQQPQPAPAPASEPEVLLPEDFLRGVTAVERIDDLRKAGIQITVMPSDGFPERHMVDPADFLRTADEDARMRYIRYRDKPKLILHTAGQMQKKDIPSKLSSLREMLKIILAGLAVEVEAVNVPGDEDQYVDAPLPWLVFGLTEDAWRILVEYSVWSTPWVTFFVETVHEKIPNFVMRIRGLTHNHLNTVEIYMRQIMRSTHFVEKLAAAMSNDATYTPRELEAARKFVETIKVVPHGAKIGDEVTADIITTTPPTNVIFQWKNWRKYLRECLFFLPWNTVAEIAEVVRCRECHGAAHEEYECPFLDIPGWHPTIVVPKKGESSPAAAAVAIMVHRDQLTPAQRALVARRPPLPPAGPSTRERREERAPEDRGGREDRGDRDGQGGRAEPERRGDSGRDGRHEYSYHPYPPRADKGEGGSRQTRDEDKGWGKKSAGGKGNRGK
ncbi:hypothetical protein C8Q70DRAFT_935324 [Cubamyces menziesii]|nr:hypothetical protein C8Q70DRAFT_935324 [Cubamyces menziesii]